MDEKMNGLPEENEFVDIIELTDEDGVSRSFELVDTLDLDGCEYVALIAAPDDAEELLQSDGNLVILKIVAEEGEDDILSEIEDDDEFDKVSEIFMDRLADLYEFDEDED